MRRVLVVSGATDSERDPNSNDATMQEVFDLTLASKQRYAKKHGYDFLSIRSFGEDQSGVIPRTKYGPHIGFIRVVRVFELLNAYDTVMWIDADSIVTNDNYKIEDFGVDDHHSFYASYDWEWKMSFSTGNFIVNKTKHTNYLINEFYRVCKNYESEQATLNDIFRRTNLNVLFRILDHKYLGAIPSIDICKDFWGNRSGIPWPWTKECFLVHLTGLANSTRIDIANRHYNEYL